MNFSFLISRCRFHKNYDFTLIARMYVLPLYRKKKKTQQEQLQQHRERDA